MKGLTDYQKFLVYVLYLRTLKPMNSVIQFLKKTIIAILIGMMLNSHHIQILRLLKTTKENIYRFYFTTITYLKDCGMIHLSFSRE